MGKKKVNKNKKMPRETVYNYVAVLDPAKEGGFNVSFPALPGCVTFGNNLSHAKRMAKEALTLWIEELLHRKKKIPSADTGVAKITITVAKK